MKSIHENAAALSEARASRNKPITKSRAPWSPRNALLGSAVSALFLGFFGLVNPASAGAVTLCPSQATVGGISETSSDVAGPLDGTCGANSAVQINIPATNDYGKLQFNSSMSGYPAGLTLGGFEGASANVLSSGNGEPYYLLAFTDGSNSLGQGAASDQILFIEFQASTLAGNTLAVDPASTLFNLYDNTTGQYLQGGQSDANSLNTWLTDFSALENEALQGIWIGEGLDSSDHGPESLTVNSLTVTTAVPEPSALALFGAGLLGFVGFAAMRRRRPVLAR
jgi:hypothetical protein